MSPVLLGFICGIVGVVCYLVTLHLLTWRVER